jgi:hypothetical protein
MTVVTGLIMIFALAGCPYESSVPLSNSCNSAIDSTLLGSWVDPSAKGSDTIRIMRFNDHEYYVEVHSKGQNGINSISRGRAFVTAIKNQKILNFCELGEPDKFVFLKYEIKGNLMKTYSVSDKSIKKPLNSSRELFSYFTISSDKQGFYELPDSAVRVK